VGGDQFKGRVLPTPTYHEAYAEWIKDLSGTALFVLIIVYGSIISSERKSGTAVLVLTKPVSRTAFIIAKAVVHSAFLAVLVVAGTLITGGSRRRSSGGHRDLRFGLLRLCGWCSASSSSL